MDLELLPLQQNKIRCPSKFAPQSEMLKEIHSVSTFTSGVVK